MQVYRRSAEFEVTEISRSKLYQSYLVVRMFENARASTLTLHQKKSTNKNALFTQL